MIDPKGIVDILAAVTPIVTSVTSATSNNIESKKSKEKTPTVNVTINNHFHTNSLQEAQRAASTIEEQIINSVALSKNPYKL